MRKIKARACFMGENGQKRVSCAQAIAQVFSDKFRIDESLVSSLNSSSGGRAPEGICGALYATKRILEANDLGGFENIKAAFKSEAGSDKCKEIKALKKLSCADCVSKAAEFLDKV